jgi:hypothetical protein|tara:strand:+ start:218 stop:511 length:294 start_codon:yes stop_codon:yes gene_type:complete
MRKKTLDKILISSLSLLLLSSLTNGYLERRGGHLLLNQKDFREARWVEVKNDEGLRYYFNEQKISHRKYNWKKYKEEVAKMNDGRDSDETILIPYFG